MGRAVRGVRRRRGVQGVSVAPHNTLQVSPSSFSIAVGVGQIVTVTARDASNNSVQNLAVSATSDNTAVANPALATGTGPYQVTVFGVANGTATITFTAGGVTGTASVTVTNPPTNWADNMIGSTKVLLVDPGTVGSSQQRVEWSTLAQQMLDNRWAVAVNLPGAYPMLSGSAPNNAGYMQYYDGAINHWAFAKMKNEGSSGTYKTRGDRIADEYISYCIANNNPLLGAQHHHFPETILAYYLMYGDTRCTTLMNQWSRIWNGSQANQFPDGIRNNLGVAAGEIFQGRIMARYILSGLSMQKAGITSSQRVASGAYLRTYATPLAVAQDYCAVAVERQLADGSWNMGGKVTDAPGTSMHGAEYLFHGALLCDAMYKVDLYAGTTNYTAAIAAHNSFLKNNCFNTGWPYTGSNPFFGQGMADYSRDSANATYTVPFSSTPVGAGGVGMNIDLGNLFAICFHRAGDSAFARQLLGTTQANAYGTSQAKYGAMAPASTNLTGGTLTQMKQMNEFMWQAWEYMP